MILDKYNPTSKIKRYIRKKAIKKVEIACKSSNFPLGFHVIEPEHKDLQEKVKLGYSFIAFSLDFFFLGKKARAEMEEIHHG